MTDMKRGSATYDTSTVIAGNRDGLASSADGDDMYAASHGLAPFCSSK